MKVIPVIVVPGIMGSNLCATRDQDKEQNKSLRPGEAAWRPPNGIAAGLHEAAIWERRDARTRQQILAAESLDVDPTGTIETFPDPAFAIDVERARDDGWGEIHAASYGKLLLGLNKTLNSVFKTIWGKPVVNTDWLYLNKQDRGAWNTTATGLTAPLTHAELEKLAEYHYPIYAFGYNWLQSNEVSATRLQERIASIKKYWVEARRDCKQVLLVTHSMGGLVARACATKIPDDIVGIVHAVMPALGAPVCYLRIACGTETSSPSNGMIADVSMKKFAQIAGETAAMTTPVMATAPGPLELLPNHRYPQPWLFASVVDNKGKSLDLTALVPSNPYDLYRDSKSWYRMIDLGLVDPVNKYRGKAAQQVRDALDQAERFHRTVIRDDYHVNTFAFYGGDRGHLSFGNFRWTAKTSNELLSAASLNGAAISSYTEKGGRRVLLADGRTFLFERSEQDVPGDGTVPNQSGAGPAGRVKQIFCTAGYDHQGSYNDGPMLALTQHLIAKIVQDAK